MTKKAAPDKIGTKQSLAGGDFCTQNLESIRELLRLNESFPLLFSNKGFAATISGYLVAADKSFSIVSVFKRQSGFKNKMNSVFERFAPILQAAPKPVLLLLYTIFVIGCLPKYGRASLSEDALSTITTGVSLGILANIGFKSFELLYETVTMVTSDKL
jgi:hypothetical protein